MLGDFVRCSWLCGGTHSGGASPLLMAGRRQVISCISKGRKNILIYNFIISAFDCRSQDGCISVRAFALACPGVAPPLCRPTQRIINILIAFWSYPAV